MVLYSVRRSLCWYYAVSSFHFVRLVRSFSRLLPPFPLFSITACSLYFCIFLAVSHSIASLLLYRFSHFLFLSVVCLAQYVSKFATYNCSNGRCSVICSHSVAILLIYFQLEMFCYLLPHGRFFIRIFSGMRFFIDLFPLGRCFICIFSGMRCFIDLFPHGRCLVRIFSGLMRCFIDLFPHGRCLVRISSFPA